MAENRTPRDNEVRATQERVEHWRPASILPDPLPQDGFVFRWIRTSMMGKSDPTNVSGKMREGWVPVKADDHPELQLFTNPDPNSPFRDNVEVGGLLLCKISKRIMEQREAYYVGQAEAQEKSVDNTFLRESDSRMPLFSEKRSKVSFGKGS